VIKQLFEQQGGILRTGFKGPYSSLIKVPTLTNYFEFAEYPESDITHVFATEYTKGNYEHTRSAHYQLLQEVINRPNLGITLSPVADWTS
jgi:hypothetical protein